MNPNLTQHIDFYKEQYMPYQRFLLAPIGSWNYNCADSESDVDTKAIFIPTIDDIVKNKHDSYTHIFPNQEHFEGIDIRNFLSIINKGNPQFIEILFSPWQNWNKNKYKNEINDLLSLRDDIAYCYPMGTMRAFLGMADRNYNLSVERQEEEHFYKWVYVLLRIEECMDKYAKGYPFDKCITTNYGEMLIEVKRGRNIFHIKDILVDSAYASIKSCHNIYDNYFQSHQNEANQKTQEALYEIVKSICQKSLKGE